jgi:uncharacterized protein (TIGR04255 family)
MANKLPIKLGNEPLVDAVFEVRFTSTAPASDVLPGFLFSSLEGDKILERLPTADLPKPVRDADPNLHFAPLTRLRWNNFVISIGDRSLIVGCNTPYPGWAAFKPAILQIIEKIKEIGIIQTVNRFSVKYTDIISSSDIQEQISLIKTSIVLGDHTLEKENFSLRIEIPEDDILHAVNVISSATATLADGSKREGIVIDIDSITNVDNEEFGQWLEQLPDNLEKIHAGNKNMFFKCLPKGTLDSLEPIYE